MPLPVLDKHCVGTCRPQRIHLVGSSGQNDDRVCVTGRFGGKVVLCVSDHKSGRLKLSDSHRYDADEYLIRYRTSFLTVGGKWKTGRREYRKSWRLNPTTQRLVCDMSSLDGGATFTGSLFNTRANFVGVDAFHTLRLFPVDSRTLMRGSLPPSAANRRGRRVVVSCSTPLVVRADRDLEPIAISVHVPIRDADSTTVRGTRRSHMVRVSYSCESKRLELKLYDVTDVGFLHDVNDVALFAYQYSVVLTSPSGASTQLTTPEAGVICMRTRSTDLSARNG